MATVEDRLREWIDRHTQVLEGRGVDYLKGYDWFQVDSAEQDVFRLDPETMARVVAVFGAYEAIADICHNDLRREQLCNGSDQDTCKFLQSQGRRLVRACFYSEDI